MKDIQIPNGYFHLWKIYFTEQQIDPFAWESFKALQAQIEAVLRLPIAQQSSYALFRQMIELTQQQFQRPQLIYEMAHYIRPEHFGVLGYMATRSDSIAEALDYILRFNRLVIDGDEIAVMKVQQQQDCLSLSWPFIHEAYDLINEMTTAFMIGLARQIVPLQQFPLERIGFAHAPKMALYHYQKFYSCEVSFHQPEYQMLMGIRSLDLKLQHADPSLIQFLIQQAEQAIASKAQHETLAQKLHLIVAEYLRIQQQAPKIEDIAKELHVSVRTLQRQLRDLNSSFKQILETERMQQCEKLLQKQLNLTEIAMQLGYSDQSALARAYKAHTGQTLLQAKKNLGH